MLLCALALAGGVGQGGGVPVCVLSAGCAGGPGRAAERFGAAKHVPRSKHTPSRL